VEELVLVFLAQSQLLVLLKEDLALTLKLLEIFVERRVHLTHTVYHHQHEHVVGAHARTNQLVYVVCHTHQGLLQRFLGLA
jgi:hypothetical protein